MFAIQPIQCNEFLHVTKRRGIYSHQSHPKEQTSVKNIAINQFSFSDEIAFKFITYNYAAILVRGAELNMMFITDASTNNEQRAMRSISSHKIKTNEITL